MRRLWLIGTLIFLGALFWQIWAQDPYFYLSAHDLFRRAQSAQQEGDQAKALEFAQRAWGREPQNWQYAEFLAWRYLEADRPEKALELFQQIGQQQPTATALTGQVTALTRLDRRQAALKLLASHLAAHPQDAATLRLAADLAAQETATQEQALAYYQRLAALTPQDQDIRRRLVELYIALGRFAAAIPLQEQVVADDPENVQALHQLALLYAWQQDHQAAVPIYQRLLERAAADQALRLEAARNAEAAKDLDQAILHYLALYARSGGQKEYALVLARLWSQTGKHAEAAAVLAPLMVAQPTLEERRFYALELLLAGDYGPALKAYRQVWEAGDSHKETILNLARLSAQQQHFRQAAAFWDEAARRQLLDADLRREAALTYAYARRYQDAAAVLQPVDRREPKLLLFLGQMHFYQKQWRQAVHYYQEYLRQAPHDVAARRQLAQTLSFLPESLEAAAREYEAAAQASGDPALLLQRAAVLLQSAQNATDDPDLYQEAPVRWAAAHNALQQVPSTGLSPELLREQGILWLWLGDLEPALACLEKYLQVRPHDRQAHLDKARTLIYLQQGATAADVLRRLPPPSVAARTSAQAGGEGDEAVAPSESASPTAGGAGTEIEVLTLFLEAALADRQWPEAQRRAWQLYLTQMPADTPAPQTWTAARRRLREAGTAVSLPPATRVAMARALCLYPQLDQEQEVVRVAVDLCIANLRPRPPVDQVSRQSYQAALLLLKYLLPRLSHYEDLQELVDRLPGVRAQSPEYLAALNYFSRDLGRQGGKLQYLLQTLEDRERQHRPRRPGDLLFLAALASELGDYRQAVRFLEQVQRLRPQDERLATLRQQALAAAHESGRLLQALAARPQTPENALAMAQVSLERLQYDGALALLAAVARGDRLWPQAQMLAIQAYQGLQNYPAALAAIRELQTQGHRDLALTMAEAQVLEAMDDRRGAQAAYQTVSNQTPDAFTAQMAQARLARLRRDWAGAYRHFTAALRARPQDIGVLNELEQIREELRPTLAARNLPPSWRGARRPEEALRPWQFGRHDRDPGTLGGSRGSARSLLPFRLPYALTPETTVFQDRHKLEALETRLAGGLWLSRLLPVHLALGYRVYQQHTTGPGPANLNLGLQPVFQQTSHNRTTWERGEATLTLGPLVMGERLKLTGDLSGRRYWRQLKQQVSQYGQKTIPFPPVILNTLAGATFSEKEARNRLLGSLALDIAVGASTDLTLRYGRRDIFDQDPAIYPRLFQQISRLDTLPLLTLDQVDLALSHQFFPGLSYQGNLAQAFFSDLNQRFTLYQGLRWQAVNQPHMHLDLTPSYYLALYRYRREAYFSPHTYQAFGLSIDFDRQLFPMPILPRFLFLLPTLVLQVTGQVVDNDGRWGPALSTLAGLEAEPVQNLYVGLHYFFFKEWATNYWFNSLIFGLKWRF